MAVRGNVLVVGSINVDLVIRVGELPAPGRTVSGGTFARHNGGKGANQAMAAARAGAAVTLVGAVGDDEFGRGALVDLSAAGVDVSRVSVLSGAATGLALIVVDENGENQIAVAPGANAVLDGAAVEAALADFAPDHAPDEPGGQGEPGGAFLANFEMRDEAIVAGARVAAAHGMRIVINPAPPRDVAPDLFALAPILVPNEHEAEALTGEREPLDAARLLSGRSGAPVIVTLGAAGCLLYEPGGTPEAERLPAPIVDAVDTTGAGDAFAGALAAGLASGSSLREAAAAAVEAASLSVTSACAR
ncbi:MAG: PfkB family carbohydrate kinase [Chloroflexota bacterium]